MDSGTATIIGCAVLAAAVAGVGIFLTVHFCCQRRRRQHAARNDHYEPASSRRGRPRRRHSPNRQGRTTASARPTGGTVRPPPPPPPSRPRPTPSTSSHENCLLWLNGGGQWAADVNQPLSFAAASEASDAAVITIHSQPTYCEAGEVLTLEVDGCELPHSPPPPPPQPPPLPARSETRQERKERERFLTQRLFPNDQVGEEQVYALREIFSEPQLSRASHLPLCGAPHPSSAPPAVVQLAALGHAAFSRDGGVNAFGEWPVATVREVTSLTLVGPVETDGGSGHASDTSAKRPYAMVHNVDQAHPRCYGSVFERNVSSANTTITAASPINIVSKPRQPDAPAQARTPEFECQLPEGSPPRTGPPRAPLGLPRDGTPRRPPSSTDCATCSHLSPAESRQPPSRPASIAIVHGVSRAEARVTYCADPELPPVGRDPDLNIVQYLRGPSEIPDRSPTAGLNDRILSDVEVATAEELTSDIGAKPRSLLGPNSLRTLT